MATDTVAGGDTVKVSPTRISHALAQRLEAVSRVMDEHAETGTTDPAPTDPFATIERFVAGLQSRPDVHRTWLLLTAVCATFPHAQLVRETRRRISHKTARDATVWLLRNGAATMSSRDAIAEIEVVDDRPFVDVDFSARADMLTGIQRVVRSVVPRWESEHSIVLAKWADQKMYAGLTPREARRLGASPSAGTARKENPTRLVPWGVPVLLPEVPFAGHGDRLSALARYSPSSVRIIGYDCIPAVSGELVDAEERDKFANYLEMVKYVDRVVAISDSAAGEFRGFVGTLAAQGLVGPTVDSCLLPTTVTVDSSARRPDRSGVPEIVCVGTLDDRKNQIAVAEAAEHLWRKGLDFRLRLVGGIRPRSRRLLDFLESLEQAGRPVVVADQPVTDRDLDAAYRGARVVAFPSVHEGFGLPVVEALSYGVPVVTSDFGSTREIVEGGGAVLVDPEDVFGLADCLKRLLTDDEAHAALAAQARSRPLREWQDYASDLWELVAQ